MSAIIIPPIPSAEPQAAGFANCQNATLIANNLPPTITGLSPSSGPTNGGTSVKISGTYLFGVTKVMFGPVPVSSFTIDPSGQFLVAISPPDVAGSVYVTVVGPAGAFPSTPSIQFTYSALSLPVITSISPSSGTVTGGTIVTLQGSGFTGATSVQFGAAVAKSFTVNSDTTITAVTPAGPPGGTLAVVWTPAGKSNGVNYTFAAVPSPWKTVQPSDNFPAILAGLRPGDSNQFRFIPGQNYSYPSPIVAGASYALDMQNAPTSLVPAPNSTTGFSLDKPGTEIFNVNLVGTSANANTVAFLVKADCNIHDGKTSGTWATIVKVMAGPKAAKWTNFTCGVVNDYAGYFGGSITVNNVTAMGSIGQATFRTDIFTPGDPLPANVIVEGCTLHSVGGSNAKGVHEWREYGAGCKFVGNFCYDYVRVGQLSATSIGQYGTALSFTGNTFYKINPTVPQNLMIVDGVVITVTANNFIVGPYHVASLAGPSRADFSSNNIHEIMPNVPANTTCFDHSSPPASTQWTEVGTKVIPYSPTA